MNITFQRTDDRRTTIPRRAKVAFDSESVQLQVEAVLGSSCVGISLGVEPNEAEATAHLHVPVIGGLHVRFGSKALRYLVSGRVGVGLDWSDLDAIALHWDPGPADHMGVFDVTTALFGERVLERKITHVVLSDLLLPERAYPCVITFVETTSYRKGAPVLTREVTKGADIAFASPLRFPSKSEGELGPRKTEEDTNWFSSMYVPHVETVPEVLAEAMRRVLTIREERARYDWQPSAGIVPAFTVHTDHVPTGDWAALDGVGRWLGARAGMVRLYAANRTAMLVIRVHKMPATDVLQNAISIGLLDQILNRTKADEVLVALVIGSTVHRVTWGKGRDAGKLELRPFDVTLWPGSVSAFLP